MSIPSRFEDTRMGSNCRGGHRMGYWHDPFTMEKTIKISETNEYRTIIQLVQYRCCLDCGQAELRIVT